VLNFLILLSPALGGLLLGVLWATRGHVGTAVGQIPVSLRRRRAQAVRREVSYV
jgi:hypothetical protein